MKILVTVLLTLFTASIAVGQEKKIKKAIEALNENNFEECFKYLGEYSSEASPIPLATYVEYLVFTKQGSPNYDIEQGFKKIQTVNQWMNSYVLEKSWCKSFGICLENIPAQIDSLAIKALRIVEASKSDENYQHFIQTYTNTPINLLGIESYQHWKFEGALAVNSVASLESFVKDFPNSKDVGSAKQKIEEIEYSQCNSLNDISIIQVFLKKYPNSNKKNELYQKLIELEFKRCSSQNDKTCFNDFLTKYPTSNYFSEIKIKIEEIDFSNAKKSGTKESLDLFIHDYPTSKYIAEAKKKLDELVNGVVITCSGQGKTQDDAKQNALRSAIEQTFGTFISSKTELLNDVLESDQITSLASGNIKSYEIITQVELPAGGFSITLRAIISVDNLTNFVQSKGVAAEIKGGLFAMNVKQQLLNEAAEIQIITNLIGTIHNVLQQSFDYNLEVSEPRSLDGNSEIWEIPMLIKVQPNKNMNFCANYLSSNLKAISLSKEEQLNYKKINKPVYAVSVSMQNAIDTFYLRTKNAISSFNRLDNMWFYTHSFFINNGIKKLREIGTINREIFTLGSGLNTIDFPKEQQSSPIIQPSSMYHTSNELTMKLNFISSDENKNQVVYYYSDKLSLSDLEKINKYEIFQDTIRNEFTNGGYLLTNKENNFNIILSPNPELVFVKAKTKGYASAEQTFIEIKASSDSTLNKLNTGKFNGHNDWRLASTSEIKSFVDNYVKNNFDNEMFKQESFGFDDEKLELIYYEPYQDPRKYHWNGRVGILSSTIKKEIEQIPYGATREYDYNLVSYFDEFIAHIKERTSEDYLSKEHPLRGDNYYNGSRIPYFKEKAMLLLIVRTNN